MLLALSSVSCGVMKRDLDDDIDSGYPTRQRRTHSSVRRNNGNHNRDWAKTKPNDDDYYDDRGIDNGPSATDEEWKRLDIKLYTKKLRVGWAPHIAEADTPSRWAPTVQDL